MPGLRIIRLNQGSLQRFQFLFGLPLVFEESTDDSRILLAILLVTNIMFLPVLIVIRWAKEGFETGSKNYTKSSKEKGQKMLLCEKIYSFFYGGIVAMFTFALGIVQLPVRFVISQVQIWRLIYRTAKRVKARYWKKK